MVFEWMGLVGNHLVGPYDFRDVENADGIAESSHKNGIYCISRNVTKFGFGLVSVLSHKNTF